MSPTAPPGRRLIGDALRAERRLDVSLVAYATTGQTTDLFAALHAAHEIVAALQAEQQRTEQVRAILVRRSA